MVNYDYVDGNDDDTGWETMRSIRDSDGDDDDGRHTDERQGDGETEPPFMLNYLPYLP